MNVPDALRVSDSLSLPLGEIEIRVSRSGGPGGQHANTAATKVEAVFDVQASATLSEAQKQRAVDRAGPVVRAVAQDERSQARNRELALERLAEKIRACLHVETRRVPTRPTGAARKRRLESKRRRAESKRLRRKPDDSA